MAATGGTEAIAQPQEFINATCGYQEHHRAVDIGGDRLGYARFNLGLSGLKSVPDPDFVTMHYHSRSKPMFRHDRPYDPIAARSLTVLPPDGGVGFVGPSIEFDHFYLPRRLLRRAVNELEDRDLQDRDLRPLFGHFDDRYATKLELASHCLRFRSVEEEEFETLGYDLVEGFFRILRGDAATGKSAQGPLSPRQLDRIIERIEADLGESLRLEELAETLELDVFRFLRGFRRRTGMTPHQYLLRRRVVRACELLMSGNGDIAEVAYSVGFSSQAHMTSRFRKSLGLTPAQFRGEGPVGTDWMRQFLEAPGNKNTS